MGPGSKGHDSATFLLTSQALKHDLLPTALSQAVKQGLQDLGAKDMTECRSFLYGGSMRMEGRTQVRMWCGEGICLLAPCFCVWVLRT